MVAGTFICLKHQSLRLTQKIAHSLAARLFYFLSVTM